MPAITTNLDFDEDRSVLNDLLEQQRTSCGPLPHSSVAEHTPDKGEVVRSNRTEATNLHDIPGVTQLAE